MSRGLYAALKIRFQSFLKSAPESPSISAKWWSISITAQSWQKRQLQKYRLFLIFYRYVTSLNGVAKTCTAAYCLGWAVSVVSQMRHLVSLNGEHWLARSQLSLNSDRLFCMIYEVAEYCIYIVLSDILRDTYIYVYEVANKSWFLTGIGNTNRYRNAFPQHV